MLKAAISSILYLLFATATTQAQAPFHLRIDHKGKPHIHQLTGKPYEMAVYRDYDILDLIKLNPQDTLQRVIAVTYSYHEPSEKFDGGRADTFFLANTDFKQNPYYRGYVFRYGYPYWTELQHKPRRLHPQKGQYHYSLDDTAYVRATPLAPADFPGPQQFSKEKKYPVTYSWQLDSAYRITATSDLRGHMDSAGQFYEYNGQGLIARTVKRNNTKGGITSFFFYNSWGKPRYVITVANNPSAVDKAFCTQQLQLMKEHYRNVDLYQIDAADTVPKVLYLAAYNYDSKGRMTSCTGFMDRRTVLKIDSVTYNKAGLPDTIDRYSLGSNGGERMALTYDRNNRVTTTQYISSGEPGYRNLKLYKALVWQAQYFYDKQGRMMRIERKDARKTLSKTEYKYFTIGGKK